MLVLGTRELLCDSVSAWSDLSAPKPGLGTSEQVRASQPQFLQSVKWGGGTGSPWKGVKCVSAPRVLEERVCSGHMHHVVSP